MNAVVRALFDDAAITGAQAAGLKDTSTAAMRAAVREATRTKLQLFGCAGKA